MREQRYRNLSLALLGLLVLPLMGCFGKPKALTPPSKFDISVSASQTLNRDPEGNPLSVVVRFFMLKGKGEFSKLTYEAACSGRTDAELLGADLVGRTETVVVPGITQTQTLDLAAGTQYIGMVAFFRKPDPHYWRYLASLPAMNVVEAKEARKARKKQGRPEPNPTITFTLQDCYITLQGLKPEPIPGQPESAKPDCGVQPLPPPPPPVSAESETQPKPQSRPAERSKPGRARKKRTG